MRRRLGGGALSLNDAIEKRAWVPVRNESGCDVSLLSGCAMGVGDDA